MCRNIKILYNFQPPTTEDEVHAAAVQYVRKVSGMTKPSQANEAAFERAVEAIAGHKVAFEPNAIPAVVFTDPEVAWCGLTETEAAAKNRTVSVAKS